MTLQPLALEDPELRSDGSQGTHREEDSSALPRSLRSFHTLSLRLHCQAEPETGVKMLSSLDPRPAETMSWILVFKPI